MNFVPDSTNNVWFSPNMQALFGCLAGLMRQRYCLAWWHVPFSTQCDVQITLKYILCSTIYVWSRSYFGPVWGPRGPDASAGNRKTSSSLIIIVFSAWSCTPQIVLRSFNQTRPGCRSTRIGQLLIFLKQKSLSGLFMYSYEIRYKI